MHLQRVVISNFLLGMSNQLLAISSNGWKQKGKKESRGTFGKHCRVSSVPFYFFLECNIHNLNNSRRFRKLSQCFAFLNFPKEISLPLIEKFGNFEVKAYRFFFYFFLVCFWFLYICFSCFWRSHECVTSPGAFIIVSAGPMQETVTGLLRRRGTFLQK